MWELLVRHTRELLTTNKEQPQKAILVGIEKGICSYMRCSYYLNKKETRFDSLLMANKRDRLGDPPVIIYQCRAIVHTEE